MAVIPVRPAAAAVPVVSIAVPPVDGDNGWYRAQPTLTIAAEEPSSGIKSLSWSWGSGTTTRNYKSPFPLSVTETTSPPAPGTRTLSATATSGTSETASTSQQIKWDPDAPSVPLNPRWVDSTGILVESVSSGDEQICGRWNASSDAVSGLRDYRLQLAETADFAQPLVDRYTGSTLTRACFTATDGVRYGHSYYFRVAARDQAGNESAWSAASNRVDVSDQATGPALAHAPVLAAFVGRDIPISLVATCEADGPCSARLYYRPTPISGVANAINNSWTRTDLALAATTTLNGRSAIEWVGTVPASAVTSSGVDYFVEAEDTFALTQFPGGTYVGTTMTAGLQPAAHGFVHVAAVAPPLVSHVPVPFGRDGEPVPVSIKASCSATCSATLYYRTTGFAGSGDLVGVPAWPRVTMTETSSEPVAESARLVTFDAEVPSDTVDTANGVDYFVSVTDGVTTTYWPGTSYVGHYAPTDGMRTGYHHVYVLETPHVVHEPVAAVPYRSPVAVDAQATCTSGSCSGVLYYRTTTSSVTDPAPAFGSTPMTTTHLTTVEGVEVVALHGEVPSAATDTRGVDYFFSVSDGATTTWWPGTSTADAYGVEVDGRRVGWHHVRVLDPPHLAHVQAAVAVPVFEDLPVEAELTCATESCSVTLHYTDSFSPTTSAPFTAVVMSRVSDEVATPAGRLATYRGVVPGSSVTTRGVAYYFEAFDGYMRTYWPGTTDHSAYLTVGASRVAAHVVRVLEPPHIAHAPQAVSYYSAPIEVEAQANCATGSCTGTLHWRTSGHPWQSAPMTQAPAATGSTDTPVGVMYSYRAAVPGLDATTEGVDYRITVNDGYVTASSSTHHVTVLAPTAVLHAPTVTAFPGRDVPLEAVVPCSTPTCSVTLSYRPTGQGLLSEPAWTEIAMAPVGTQVPVGDATVVRRYAASIPADAVTTRGVDYFIRGFDGHTTAYSPGTAYAATSSTTMNGQRVRYFHVHVAEPVRILHQPMLVANWDEPAPIRATVNCATRNCSGTLSYRSTTGVLTATGIPGYLNGQPAFTHVPMTTTVVEDLGEAGTVVEFSAEVPREAVTTEGFDYYFRVSDGSTNAWYPGTSYIGGAGSVDGMRAAWQHVEVPARTPVRAIFHAPTPAAQIREPIVLRFAAYCSADRSCVPTVWYRTTPAGNVDTSQLLLAEPDWPTIQVTTTVDVRPSRSGLVLHLFEARIPPEAVDTTGVDYLIKVSDGWQHMYWPGAPSQGVVATGAFPLVAFHVTTVASPLILHTPRPAANAGGTAELAWTVVCTSDIATSCQTAAYHSRFGDPGSFSPLATTAVVVATRDNTYVIEARASIPAAQVGDVDFYFLWASDSYTNVYFPGTTYQGAVVAADGIRTGYLPVYRYDEDNQSPLVPDELAPPDGSTGDPGQLVGRYQDPDGNPGNLEFQLEKLSGDTSSYDSPVRDDAPVSYWRLGETSGTTAADEQYLNDGHIEGGVLLGQPGAVSGDAAMRFDGIDDQIKLGADASLKTGRFTIEAWFNADPARSGAGVIFAGGGTQTPRLWLNSDDHLVGRVFGPAPLSVLRQAYTVTSPAAYADGAWHHAAFVKTGTDLVLYVDGNEVARTAMNDLPYLDSNPSGIGRDVVNARDGFTGSIDEVAYYAYPLSAGRVRSHFFSGVSAGTAAGVSPKVVSGSQATWVLSSLPPGSYRWRARAYDGHLFSAWTAYQTLTVT